MTKGTPRSNPGELPDMAAVEAAVAGGKSDEVLRMFQSCLDRCHELQGKVGAAGNLRGERVTDAPDTRSRDACSQFSPFDKDSYYSLFEKMTEGFAVHEIVCDESGAPVDYRFLDINPAFEALTGLKQADVKGKLVTEVIPGIEKHWIEAYGRVALTGEPTRFENYSSALNKYYHVFAYRPAPGQFAVLFSDITGRRRMELALQESNAALENRVRERTAELHETMTTLENERRRFIEVLDSLPAYVALMSPDYHMPFANRFFRERFGASNGKRCYEFLFDRTEPCEVCETFKVLENMQSLEWEWTGPDNRNYYIFDFPFTDTDGSTLILEVGLDITEQKQTETELELHRRHLEQLVQDRTAELTAANDRLHTEVAEHTKTENVLRNIRDDLNRAQAVAHVGSWRLNARMNELRWSDETYHIFAIPIGTRLTYEKFLDCAHPDDRDYVDRHWKAAMKGEPYDIEHRIIVNGNVKWVREQAELEFDRDGKLLGGFGTVQDITDGKLAEKELQEAYERIQAQTEELQAQNEELQTQSEELQTQTEELMAQTEELHRAYDSLSEIEEDLRRAQEIGHVGSWRLDTRNNVLTWSPENHRIFGLPEGTEMSYETFLSTIHPDDREFVDWEWTKGLSGQPYDIEHRIIVNGEVKWVREKADLEFDGDGHVMGGFGITQDITARKRAEEEIRRLALFPEENPHPVMRVTAEGKILYANRSAEPFVREWCTAKGKLEVRIRDRIRSVREAGVDLTVEENIGDNFYSVTFAFISGADYVNIYGLDISDRKLAENELRRRTIQMELLAEAAGGLLRSPNPQEMIEGLCRKVMEHLDCQVFFNFLVDRDFERLHLNAYAGIDEDEAHRIEWLDYGVAVCGTVARDRRPMVMKHVSSATSPDTGLIKSYGVDSYACHPLIGKQGELLGTLSFGSNKRAELSDDDIALMRGVAAHVAVAIARIRSEEELLESERQYRSLVDNAQSIILRWKPDGAIEFVNDYGADFFGYNKDELVGKPVSILVPDTDSKGHDLAAMIDNISENPEQFHININENILKNGGIVTVAWANTPIIDADGNLVEILAIGNDITAMKQLEARVERIHREQDAFMRHEIRNLITPIKIHAANLRMSREGLLTERQKDLIGKIEHSIDRISAFTEKLKNVTGFELGTTKLQLADYALDQLLDETITDIMPVAEQQAVTVRFNKGVSDMIIPLDRHFLPGVFSNLILNAIQHVAPLDGAKERVVTIDFDLDGGRPVVSIRNGGVPIPPERLATFFDKFNTGPEKRGGTGLGTTYAFHVTRAHGGDIRVTSSAEDGTIVKVIFPEYIIR